MLVRSSRVSDTDVPWWVEEQLWAISGWLCVSPVWVSVTHIWFQVLISPMSCLLMGAITRMVFWLHFQLYIVSSDVWVHTLNRVCLKLTDVSFPFLFLCPSPIVTVTFSPMYNPGGRWNNPFHLRVMKRIAYIKINKKRKQELKFYCMSLFFN